MSFTEAEALAEDSDMLLHLVGRGKVPVYKMVRTITMKRII